MTRSYIDELENVLQRRVARQLTDHLDPKDLEIFLGCLLEISGDLHGLTIGQLRESAHAAVRDNKQFGY